MSGRETAGHVGREETGVGNGRPLSPVCRQGSVWPSGLATLWSGKTFALGEAGLPQPFQSLNYLK